MCGISGFNWKDQKEIDKMVLSLSHRGPDAKGTFLAGGVSFGHNRLAIIDLSQSANQPMFDNERGLIIVYNGEIYNFKELKKELEGEYEFKTKSDTETILAGYRKWGKGVVDKLDGMFAFAIWDKKREELFLARDHAGIKPLYYYWDPSTNSGKVGKFIFASEIKAILEHDIPRKLNITAFNHYIRMLYTPDSMTMIEKIYKLPPSHTLTLKDKKISIEPYGDRSVNRFTMSYDSAKRELREGIIRSVKSHLVSDVPLGIYLSGGMDSSTVLSAMSQFHSDIKTFSVGFSLENKNEESKFNHDFELARMTANFFGADHHAVKVSSQDILKVFDEVVIHNDDPISNPTSIVMYLLAKFARREVKVVLTGSGGDELFGGYDRYRIALAASYYMRFPKFIRNVSNLNEKISKLEYERTADLYAKVMFEKDDLLSSVVTGEFFKSDSAVKDFFQEKYLSENGLEPAEKFLRTDQKSWLADHFFLLSDRMSMASALEERVPLMTRELKDFANSLLLSYRLNLNQGKRILRDAFKNDLPDFLFDQPKRGWFAPAAKWLREPGFMNLAREILSADYFNETDQIFNWPKVEEMFEKHINKEEYNLTTIWSIMTFQAWAKQYKVKI